MTPPTLRIGDHFVGPDYPPFIIAEMSGNHGQSLDNALRMVDAAAEAGADALKLQTYTADTITMPGVYRIDDPASLWDGEDLYTLYERAHTPWEWHGPIFERAREGGMIPFSSPFDESAVDFLESLDVPAYKIASFENEHLPLIRKVLETGKPVILSTGVVDQSGLDQTVAFIREHGAGDFALLQCTSTYPADPRDSNLRAIPELRDRYGCVVGLSDHTLGIGAPVASVALGSSIIEKHFTLDRNDGAVDAAFSLEPAELASLVKETNRAWSALGEARPGMTSGERGQRIFKRSIYIARDIAQGAQIGPDDVRVIRPSLGLAPAHFYSVIGSHALRDLKMGEPLAADDIDAVID